MVLDTGRIGSRRFAIDRGVHRRGAFPRYDLSDLSRHNVCYPKKGVLGFSLSTNGTSLCERLAVVFTAALCIGCSEETHSTTTKASRPAANTSPADRGSTTAIELNQLTVAQLIGTTRRSTRRTRAAAKTPIDQNENKKDVDVTATSANALWQRKCPSTHIT